MGQNPIFLLAPLGCAVPPVPLVTDSFRGAGVNVAIAPSMHSFGDDIWAQRHILRFCHLQR